MINFKLLLVGLFAGVFLLALALPVYALDYNFGVTTGQYVKYGNFVGSGPGVEAFNDYDWLTLQVTAVSGKEVTLLSTGQFKDGSAVPGNGSITVWNIETGTENGLPATQGPIIAANLNQGDAIPPANTFTINSTQTQTYLGVSRTVNILNLTIATQYYNTTLSYIYDKTSGMLLESKSETITQAEPEPTASTYSYSIIETNIFGSTSASPTPTTPTPSVTPSATIPEFPGQLLGITLLMTLIAIACTIALIRLRNQKTDFKR